MAGKVKFSKGSVIFNEGTFEPSMFFVVSGKVGIYSDYGKRTEKLLTELEKGRSFGEMGFVESKPRSSTAVALEDTECTVVNDDNIEEYFADHPEKAIEILKNMSDRIRELSDDYVGICDALSEFLDEEKANKEGILEKIKSFFKVDGDYSDLYREMREADDSFAMSKFMYWF